MPYERITIEEANRIIEEAAADAKDSIDKLSPKQRAQYDAVGWVNTREDDNGTTED